MPDTMALVERARHNDASAFSELYARYYKEMYRYAYYMLGSTEDAEDVVMDTVADAYASIDSLRDGALFKHWLFKILHNKAKRQRGKIHINRPLSLNEEFAGMPEESVEGEFENADILAALSQLSGEERSIIALSVVAGYTSKEISMVLSINANTVRSKQQRALTKLRRLLDGRQEGLNG